MRGGNVDAQRTAFVDLHPLHRMSDSILSNRPSQKILLFDVDGTLTPARRVRPIACL